MMISTVHRMRNTFSSMRGALFCLLLLGVLPIAYSASSCFVRFDVEPTDSTLAIGGSVLRPITVPITMANTSKAGLFGALYVEVETEGDTCPEDQDQLLAAATTLKFVAPPASARQGALQVFPSKLDVVVKLGATVFADLSFFDVSLEVLSNPFAIERQADNSSSFNITALWKIYEGIGAAESVIMDADSGPQYMDLANLNTTVNMQGTFDFEGKKIVLDTPISASFDLKDGDIAQGVEASVYFDSTVKAKGFLGCSDSCISHGKCVPLSSNQTEDIGCLCECGWSGEDCSIPTGFCSAFPNATAPSIIYQSAGTPQSWEKSNANKSDVEELIEESSNTVCELTADDCIGNTAFDANKCGCECQAGWSGSNCSLCTSNAACQISGLGKECDNTLVYSNKTVKKNYACNLRDNDPIKKFLEGDIRTLCDVATRECNVRLGSYSDAQPHISCNVSDCTFTDGSGHVNCNSLDCDCAKDLGCPAYFSEEIITIMRNAKGIKAGVHCDKEDEDWICEVIIEGLPITIEGICTQGTCLDGTESANIAPGLSNVSPPGLILALAGIIGGVLLSLSAFFIATNLWRLKLKGVLSQHGRYGGSAVSNLLLPGSTFSFEDIKCTLSISKPNSRISPNFKHIFNRNSKVGEDQGALSSSSESEAPFSKMKSQHSHGAAHCSLEYFPDIPNPAMKLYRMGSDIPEDATGNKRTILHAISGSLQKGLVMAIMGPSGSGKSTLLNILAGGASQISNCNISGSIQVDNQARDQWFHKIAAHVPQEDNQIPTLTVRECIMYSAMLRLPWHWPKSTKMSHVDQVLKELGLKKVANSQVGGSAAIRGVSGGEKRRVSIGMELVTSPKILFLDEPTSGLDSYTAASIMSTLTRLARNGRMVLLSLHQPSESVFKELDKVLLLARGHAVYCGDADGVANYFEGLGFPCPQTSNIADHILEIVSKNESCLKLIAESESAKSKQKDEPPTIKVDRRLSPCDANLADIPLSAKPKAFDVDLTPGTRAVLDLSPNRKGELVGADAHQPLDRELIILFWRTWTDTIRHPALLRLHVIVSILVGASSAIIFHNVPGDLAGMQNRAGCLFFTLTFFAFGSLTSIDLFIAERTVFNRELQGNYYRVATYFFAKATLDGLLLRILPAALYGIIVYWSIGLRPEISHVMVFFATLSLFNLAAGGLAMVIAVVSPTAGFASLATIVILLISLLFGGFLANAESLPPWLSWLQYLSIFYYGFEILFVNEVHGLDVQFDAAGLDVNVKGDLFLDTFNFSEKDLPTDIVALFGMYLGLLLLAYILLCIFHGSTSVKVKASSHKSGKKWYQKLIKSR